MLAHKRHLDAAVLVEWKARLAQPRRWLVVFHCTPSRLAGVLYSMRHSKVMVDEEVVHQRVELLRRNQPKPRRHVPSSILCAVDEEAVKPRRSLLQRRRDRVFADSSSHMQLDNDLLHPAKQVRSASDEILKSVPLAASAPSCTQVSMSAIHEADDAKAACRGKDKGSARERDRDRDREREREKGGRECSSLRVRVRGATCDSRIRTRNQS